MKSKLILGLLSLFMVFSMTSCMEKVDAGCEGIKVNLYGSDTTVYEYPTYVQTIDYEPFTINAKDGSEFTVDPTVSLKIIDGKSPAVFKKYRKELNEVIKGTLYNYVKDAFRIQLNKFTTDDIVSKRDSIENAIERYLTQALAKENFQLEQLTSGLKYPQTIVESVNAKNKAIQQAMQVENEVKVKVVHIVNEKQPDFFSKSPQEGLMEALEYYGVKHPQIVYVQAVLETGHFKSDLCLNDNNLFGLYNSKKHRYYTFDHWKDCIIAYKEMIQYKYKDGDDYLNFLKEIGYAEDSEYICKLKELIKNPP